MKTNRGRDISIRTERTLWAASAGRCEFRGCNESLISHHVTNEEGNFVEKAHIEAVSKGGARYRELMDDKELNSAENIMLMCAKCHKLVDDNPEQYTVEELKRMKREHEKRVYWLTEFDNVQKSYLIAYFANIKQFVPRYEDRLLCSAVVNDHKIPSGKYATHIGIEGEHFNDGTLQYYMDEVAVLEKNVERSVKTVLNREENLSVFALAPMPLLIKLGELLRDISNVSVYQCHRDKEDKWSWDDRNTDKVDFITQYPEEGNCKEIALNISLSADIIQSRINDTVGDMPTYKITIDSPNRLFVKNKKIMDDFIETFRQCVEHIKIHNPQIERILVFPSMPNSLAVRMGMDYMPKTDPEFDIYDQVEAGKNFIKTITIGGKNDRQ